MRNLARIIVTALVPLLILGGVPGCVARHSPDWSKVESLPLDTRIEVQFYKEGARQRVENGRSRRSTKINGYFLGVKEESVSLTEEPVETGRQNVQVETFHRRDVRKVLAYRSLEKRWPGWLALGISLAFGLQSFRAEADFVPGAQVLIGLAIPIGISIPFFLGSKMGSVYEVPPEHRDWHPEDGKHR